MSFLTHSLLTPSEFLDSGVWTQRPGRPVLFVNFVFELLHYLKVK